MEGVALIHSPHPLLAAANREIRQAQWRPGDTLAEVLQKAGITPLVPCVVLYNGIAAPVERWSLIVPSQGDLISVRATVHGGGKGGSNPIASVLSIALFFVAPALGAMVNTSLFAAESSLAFVLTSAQIGSVISLAGNMIIGALFKPETAGVSKVQGIPNASPSYSISGIHNRTRPYEPMPLVYGKHRIVPDLSSKPYTQYKGADQYLLQTFNFGPSDLLLSDWKIGDTPIASYRNVTIKEANPDGEIPGLFGDVDTLEGGTLDPRVWIERTLPANTVEVQIDVQGNLYKVNKESGGLERLEVDFEAQIQKNAEGWIPFLSSTETVNLSGYWSAGSYSGVGGSWVQIAYGTTNALEHSEGSAYVPPSGSPYRIKGKTYLWRWLTFVQADRLDIPLTRQPARTKNVVVNYVTISNKTTNLVRRTFSTINAFPEGLDPEATYQVRIRRITAAYSGSGLTAAFAAAGIRAIQKVSFSNDETSYVGQHRVGVEIRATGQLNGVLDTLNCIASARVKAGTNPDITPTETSNPAWAALDFIRGRTRTYVNAEGQTRTSRMYGVGLAETRIDLASIQAWATFCANKGLEFNGIFDQTASCAEVLQKIARCGRASVTWNTGKIGFIWDAENQPITAVFGMANIRAGSFSIRYASGKLADEVVVNFINKDTGYQRDTVRKSRAGVTNPTNPVELELFGCTDVDQAGKEANLLMAGQDYRRRTITWETDVEGLCVTRGDVVLLSHDLTQWSYSGRVVNFDGGVRLNRSIPVGGDTGKNLMLRAPDGTLYTVVVTNAEGETDLLTGSLPLISGTNPMDWLWFFGPQATPGKKVKIASVEPLDELHVRLIGVDEEAAYYAAENGTYTYVPIESVSLISPRVTKLVINESITNKNGYWQPSALIEWSVENAASWIVEVTRNGTTVYQSADAKTSQLDIPMEVGDLVNVTVIPVSTFGVNGSIANAAKTLTGAALTAKPADIPMVNAVYEGKTIWLTWNPVEDFRGITYEVRYGESWGAGTVYPCGTALRFKTQGDGNYFVAAKTSNGIYSANPKGIRVEGSTLVANVIATQDEAGSGWLGEFDRTYTKNNQVCLAGASLFSTFDPVSSENSVILAGGFDSEGYYRIPEDHVVDIGTPGACQVTSSIAFDVHDPNTLIAPVPSFAALPSVKCPAGGTGSVAVEMNIAQADGIFSGWQPFQPGTYLARLFDFRLALGSTNPRVSPFVSAWQVSVDVPDRIDSAEVTTPAGTLAVTFAKPFNDLPKIQTTIQNASAGDDIVVTSITKNGFSLTVKNGGASVSRVVHYLAQGY